MHIKYWFIFITSGLFSCIPLNDEIPRDPRTFDPPDTNMKELSTTLPYFKDFIKASNRVHIAYLLEDEGPYTIFMPNQVAFSRFRSEKNILSTDQIPDEELKNILLYHFIRGRWHLLHIPVGYYPTLSLERTTDNPIDLYIDTGALFRLNGLAPLDEPDLESTNGVIHSINAVLDLPTVMTHLSVNSQFSMIYEILNRPDIRQEFSVLFEEEEGPSTFFAPDNHAILQFLGEHPEWDRWEDVPSDILTGILKYHLISGENILIENFDQTASLIASNGSSLVIQPSYPGWFIFDGSSQKVHIGLHDIQGTNGIVHQIDRVLMP
jgi:uncharacterized surface protein with fasciclin (FAS1) repeats